MISSDGRPERATTKQPQVDAIEARRQFAVLSADHRYPAILIDAYNDKCGELPIRQAIERDAVFAVTPRPGLVVVDVDTPAVRERSERFCSVHPEIRVIVAASGGSREIRGRGWHSAEHWWFIVPAGETDESFRNWLNHAGIPLSAIRSGPGGATRPPMSRHRSGERGQVLTPEVGQALDWLRELGLRVGLPPASSSPRDNRRSPTSTYSSLKGSLSTNDILGSMSARGIEIAEAGRRSGYKERSAASFALALSMMGSDLGFDEFAHLHQDLNLAVGEKYREIAQYNQERADRELLRWWAGAQNRYQPRTSAAQVKEFTCDVMQWLQVAYEWPYWAPRTRSSDLYLLKALAQHALAVRSIQCHPGIRGLVEASGCAHQAVERSLARLHAWGWITYRQPTNQENAASIALHLGKTIGARDTKVSLGYSDPGLYMGLSSKVWQRGALGSSARGVYEALIDDGCHLTVAELAEKTGLSKPTVRKAINTLKHASWPLVAGPWPPEGTWEAMALEDPVRAERDVLLSSGWVERQHHRMDLHNRQRAGFEFVRSGRKTIDLRTGLGRPGKVKESALTFLRSTPPNQP